MIKVMLNSQEIEICKASNLEEILQEWGCYSKSNAVAINQHFVPQHQYTNTILQANDKIDIVAPMQGG